MLYQYTRVIVGCDLPRQQRYADPVTESFASDRIAFLDKNARLRRIDLHWCLTIEPDTGNPLSRKPKEQRSATDRQIFDLEKAAMILESHMSDSIGMKLLGKELAFQFFSYLFNLEEWASDVCLRSDVGVDRQLVKAPVEWHSDYLRIGRRYVQMLPLTNTPEISRPCLFTNLMELDCDSILCSVWRPQSESATRKEVTNQEKFLEFFKLSPFQRSMSGKNTAPLESTATAKAVAGNVDNLAEVVSSLDKLGQGDYAPRLLLSAGSAAELLATTPAVHRLFVDARAPIIEETYGNLSAFYAMFPGNRQFNVYPLWLREDHHARLSSIFAPHLGHPHSDDLDSEYLNVFETRTRTPYFQDAYVNGVRVQLIIGPTGSSPPTIGAASKSIKPSVAYECRRPGAQELEACPLLLSMTSERDLATKFAYPGGEFLSPSRKKTVKFPVPDDWGQTSTLPYNIVTAGNFVALQNYRIDTQTTSPCFVIVKVPGKASSQYCMHAISSLNTTPHWIMQLPEYFVPDHGTVFQTTFLQLLNGAAARTDFTFRLPAEKLTKLQSAMKVE